MFKNAIGTTELAILNSTTLPPILTTFVLKDAIMDGKEMLSVMKLVMWLLVIGIMVIVMLKNILHMSTTNVPHLVQMDGKETSTVIGDAIIQNVTLIMEIVDHPTIVLLPTIPLILIPLRILLMKKTGVLTIQAHMIMTIIMKLIGMILVLITMSHQAGGPLKMLPNIHPTLMMFVIMDALMVGKETTFVIKIVMLNNVIMTMVIVMFINIQATQEVFVVKDATTVGKETTGVIKHVMSNHVIGMTVIVIVTLVALLIGMEIIIAMKHVMLRVVTSTMVIAHKIL